MNGVLLAALQADGAGDEMAWRLHGCAVDLTTINDSLRGTSGLRCILSEPRCIDVLDRKAGALQDWIYKLERRISAHAVDMSADVLEAVHAAVIEVKDVLWAIRRDRVAWARAVGVMAGPEPSEATLESFASIQTALSALDRLEVRGRDSAGIHVLVTGHGLRLDDPDISKLLEGRNRVGLFRSGAVHTPAGHLSFVYKVASEVGELGDNCSVLRAAITDDVLLHHAVRAVSATAVVVAHTRWASVGTINEANAHPVNAEEEGGVDSPDVVAALNGDVDNHVELVAKHRLRIHERITTDAKVIPVLVARRLALGMEPEDAFRETVFEFGGSVAIASATAAAPGKQLLAVRGSGQALYVGLADDAYVVASEPYGLVEETSRYLRIEGEMHDSGNSRGQIVVLDGDGAGTLDGIRRLSYDGTELPVHEDELLTAEITTRDIDRAGYAHYLLKEISEAPTSMRKTLRGRIREVDGRLVTLLGPEALPPVVRWGIANGQITRVFVIGQGTAAVAGMAVAAAITDAMRIPRLAVVAMPASELSGFGLVADMSDTLVIAITQSGTTTDTNRTVELLRSRNASVVAIVNRRNSDITHKCDGVLFTSDGRDVEMSVASTKAFYSQVAAGMLLALAIAAAAGELDPVYQHDVLHALQGLPEAMDQVLASHALIREIAARWAPSKRHWAIVGNGPNRVAAEEIRIKLSELCYKSVAVDATEDKKHIDLSSEPLTLVCAAGLSGPAAGDVAKEVAIFRAHKSVPVVIATQGEDAFADQVDLILVPPTHPALAFLLSTMVGHLFGYEAALAIDAKALPLRDARTLLQRFLGTQPFTEPLMRRARTDLADSMASFQNGVESGQYDGVLHCSSATRISSAFRSLAGPAASDADKRDVADVGGTAVHELMEALGCGIEELTRPVDAVKHQAKTVTVGITRQQENPFDIALVEQVRAAGASRDRLTDATIRCLGALDAAVAEVTGFTRYQLAGDPSRGNGRAMVGAKSGSARNLASRTESDPSLRGTKQLVAADGHVLVTRGASDGRIVVVVPETDGGVTTGLIVLHVRLHHRLPAEQMRSVLDGYGGRLRSLTRIVRDSEGQFRDDHLGVAPVEQLLIAPLETVARLWSRPVGPTPPVAGLSTEPSQVVTISA